MNLLAGQCLQDVHLIKKNKLNYYRGKDCIEQLCKKLKDRVIEIIDYKEKGFLPLTHEENNFYNEQEACHIYK